MANELEQVRFTAHVLGPLAAFRLEKHEVTQTLRSESASIANAVLLGRVSAGDRLEVVLDNRLVGDVELVSMDAVTWEALDIDMPGVAVLATASSWPMPCEERGTAFSP